MDIFWLLIGGSYLLALIVQNRMRATYRKWSAVANSRNLTGAETARVVLDANALQQVPVEGIRGQLNDHYDPRVRAVRLSEPVFGQPSVVAMSVAAHEAGHAIQHAAGYGPLAFRSAMAPVAQFGARSSVPLLIVGLLFGLPIVAQLGVIGYVGALSFQLLTLPVEFDASKRAMQQLERLHVMHETERTAVRSILRAAAMTYVSSAASAAIYIVYLALFAGRVLLRRPPPAPPPFLP